MSHIKNNLKNLKQQIPDNVRLVAVSKTHPVDYIKEAYETGQRIFGENKVQELVEKNEKLKDYDIKWHLIGHLQTNKVKYIAEFVDLIHSVDSLKLLREINKQALKHNRIIDCLLQFHIASEETKFGLNFDQALDIFNSDEFKLMKNVRIAGVMGMASFISDEKKIATEFLQLKEMFEKIKINCFKENSYFCEISMGMSSDWKIAVANGSTLIRVGSIIFGNRNYKL